MLISQDFLETLRWLCCEDTSQCRPWCQSWAGPCPTNDISIDFKIQWNFVNALVHNILNRSQWNFTHVTTVTLSWRVQNFIVISWAHFKPECCEFLLNFEFDWNTASGMGTRQLFWHPWVSWTLSWGLFHIRYSLRNSNSMEISFCFLRNYNEKTARKFCKWH